ncbi:hypothetical protein [Stappia sp.]|uniref:hypothetical protein n=1 Tax=Stappia sp. TaxID=1870903 RepID=UPI003C7CB1CD
MPKRHPKPAAKIDKSEKPATTDAPVRVPARPALTLDVARYEAMLDDPALTDDQKRDFLETLWSIITAFVDLGFGIHPVQTAQAESHADPQQPSGELARTAATVLGSDNSLPNNNNFDPADRPHGNRAERRKE